MSEYSRFSFSPEEEAHAARAMGENPKKLPASQKWLETVGYAEIQDPRAVLKKKGRLDLGAKGALRASANGRTIVGRR